MGEQSGGLTLEGLAQRLEALTEKLGELERENETLRTKVAILSEPGTRSTEVVALRGSEIRRAKDGESASKFDGVVSRRALLGKAGRPPWPPWRRGRYSIRAKPELTTSVLVSKWTGCLRIATIGAL